MTWYRPGMRVKPVQGKADSYEIKWAPDGRALFRFDEDVIPGKRHVVLAIIEIPRYGSHPGAFHIAW